MSGILGKGEHHKMWNNLPKIKPPCKRLKTWILYIHATHKPVRMSRNNEDGRRELGKEC